MPLIDPISNSEIKKAVFYKGFIRDETKVRDNAVPDRFTNALLEHIATKDAKIKLDELDGLYHCQISHGFPIELKNNSSETTIAVFNCRDGHTYQESSLKDWLQTRLKSPVNRKRTGREDVYVHPLSVLFSRAIKEANEKNQDEIDLQIILDLK